MRPLVLRALAATLLGLAALTGVTWAAGAVWGLAAGLGTTLAFVLIAARRNPAIGLASLAGLSYVYAILVWPFPWFLVLLAVYGPGN